LLKQSRDPRFLPLAGEFSSEKFQQQYSFLRDIHTSELTMLREDLKRAKKLLAKSPNHLFDERDQEVTRLELAVKRAESLVNKDHKDTTERKALSKLRKEEREKRKHGKKKWWLKECKFIPIIHFYYFFMVIQRPSVTCSYVQDTSPLLLRGGSRLSRE
jgi:ribosomal RNA-processing protein 36